MTQRRRVVVTGLGLATALGLEVEASWRRALVGASGVTAVAGPAFERSPVRAAGVVSESDLATIRERFPEDAAAPVERRTLFALWAAGKALEQAGFSAGGTRHDSAGGGERHGVVLGAGLPVVRLEDLAPFLEPGGSLDARALAAGLDRVQPDSVLRHPSEEACELVAHRFGLCGVNLTVTSACASAAQAIGTAMHVIRRGDADLAVAGGADSMIHPVGLVYFVLLGAASTAAGEPGKACRPFDRTRTGLVMGEGAGVLVLEEAGHALARGATVLAELSGYGSSLDGYQVTAPEPTGEGAARAMRAALADAGLSPEDVDYVNAHGTGTRLNDVAETAAIKQALGARAADVPVSSSKPLFGHLLAGCGGAEAVLTVLSVARGEVHPTANLERPDRKCDLDYVPGVMRRRTVRAALSNSFGFGGQNACLAFRTWAAAGREQPCT
jgi:3-oxoacyl-[acyl-carrier-protein] synthase II